MRILYLSPRQAWPPVSGAGLRDYYFARALARYAQLTYIYFSETGGAEGLAFCEEAIGIPRPKGYTPAKIVRGLFGRWPLPVVNYTSDDMKTAIIEAGRKRRFDLIHIDALQLAGYVPFLDVQLPGVPVIYDWHNIESELMERYAANTPSLLKRIYAFLTARRMAGLERWILQTGFGHLVCSDRERLQLRRQVPGKRIEVIDNGVDLEFFNAIAKTPGPRRRIVFVGSMSYHANIEAAVWLARNIWPLIHAEWPDLHLTLVGSRPAKEVLSLAEIPGVEVTGTVDDVRPFYSDAIAAVAPLRTAGGTRLKILEAMAARVPVISTTLGAEGLDVSPGKDILIADREQDWPRAVEWLRNEADWNSLAAAAYELVRARYGWDALGDRLYKTYESWLG